MDERFNAIVNMVKAMRGEIPDPAKSMEIPYAPTTGMDSLRDDTGLAFRAQNPEPVPPRFTAPAGPDMNFVDQYSGPAPVRPTLQQPSTLEKIAAVLSGIGGGPEVAAQIRQQREAPLRQFERQNEQYQDRRARGIELAERAEERQREQAFRALEGVYEKEFRTWLQKNSDRSDEQKERYRQSIIFERDAKAARIAADTELRRERREQEREARQTSDQYFGITKNKTLSDEIGRYKAGLTGSLSPAAAALDRRVTQLGEASMGRAISVGGGSSVGRKGPTDEARAVVDRFNQAKQGYAAALGRGDGTSAQAFKEQMNRTFKSLPRFSRDVDFGETVPGWPYAQMKGQSAPAPAQQQPQAKTITRAEMQALGITEQQARAEGYTIQ